MRNKNKITSFLIAFVFALSLVFNNITGLLTVNAAVVNSIDDGAILHAWNWSFDTIKSKLPEIKAAGYTAVQTSPIQGNKEDLMASSKWWILYQPTNFKIGNAQLGNREQFKSMCAEADKYGIDIIVDVVANHTGNRGGGTDSYYPATNVDSAIKDDSSMWHEHRGVEDWNNRWQVTQWGIGLPDLNTSNKKLQNMVIDFLNDAIDCGADGFRFDAAKHIELPDDNGGSDFWPTVLGSLKNKDKLFIYGEVLQGGADRITAYHNYMSTTVDGYGGSVRSAVGYYGSANVNSAKTYPISANPSKLVTWVESHDTYANDHKETVGLTNTQIKLAWAIIAGRAGSTPLFFNRTAGGYLAGNMGAAGDDMWKDPIVVAANNFRNAMAGESEYIRTQGNNLFITERGTSGVMIVNVGGSTSVNCDTKLPNGQYVDTVSGNTFTISNGKLTGNIGGSTIATIILKNVTKEPTVSSSVGTGTKFVNSLNVTLTAQNTISATYSINGGVATVYTNGKSITLGKDAKIGDIITLTLSGEGEDGKSTTATYKYEKVDKIVNATAKIKLPSDWSSANIYVYDESVTPTKEVAKWPGVAMSSEGNGVYSYTLPDGFSNETQVIFNNGSSQIPAAEQPGFVLPEGSTMIYENGNWTSIKEEVLTAEVSSSVVSGTEFTNSLNITLSSKNTTSATYSINGGVETAYTNGKTITLGENDAVGTTYTLKLTGVGEDGKTVTQTYTYKKVPVPVIKTSVAKIKLPSGWTSANIYVYDESGSVVKEITKWPGVEMTSEGNGVYSYTLPEGWGDKTQVIFNNGSAQIPAAQQPGYYLPSGKIGTYENGTWTLEDIVIPTEPIEITSFTANKTSPQFADTTINLTASANGGKGTLEYKFTVNNGITEKVVSDYSSKNNVEWTPSAAGTYEVKVAVRDSEGTIKEKTFEFVIERRVLDLTFNSLNLDKTSGKVSEKVTISADAEGGVGSLSYKYYYKKDGKYTLIQQYGTASTIEWAPKQVGEYYICADVRDASGVTKSLSKKYVVKDESLIISSLDTDKPHVQANSEVVITANANGGSGNLQYKFYYKKDNKYTKIKDYSSENTTKWIPVEDGYYKLYVDVKDAAGEIKTKAIDFKVGNVEELTLDFTLSSKSGVVNSSVTINAISNGGIAPTTYKYYYKKDGKYTMIKDYSANSSIDWVPESEGTYAIYVAAKDASGVVTSKYISFKVGRGVEVSNITLDKTTVKVGQSVNITTTATGNSKLQYRVAVHDFENTWTTLHEFKDSNITTWKPTIADKYVIWVDVIDEDGNYSSKSIEVTVTE